MSFAADVKSIIGDPYYTRGCKYVANDMVKSLKIHDKSYISAEVIGSYQSSYSVDIDLNYDRDGNLLHIDGECSCPVSFNCKHVVAALLHANKQWADDKPKGKTAPLSHTTLSFELTNWLKQLNTKPIVLPFSTIKFDLLYVFREVKNQYTLDDGFEIALIRNQLLKSGKYSKRYYESEDYHVEMDIRQYPLEHVELLKHRSILQPSTLETLDEADRKTICIPALKALLQSGKARGFTYEGPVLQWGGHIKAKLAWKPTKNGHQKAVLVDEQGHILIPFFCAILLHIDPDNGACYVVDVENDLQVIRQFLKAPEIAPAQANLLVQKMAPLAQSGLPLPRVEQTQKNQEKPVPVLTLMGCSTQDFHSSFSFHNRFFHSHNEAQIPLARLGFEYKGHYIDAFDQDDLSVTQNNLLISMHRNYPLEQMAQQRFFNLGNYQTKPIGVKELASMHLGTAIKKFDLAFEPIKDIKQIDTGHDAVAFLNEMIPQLRKEGWKIQSTPSWPIKIVQQNGPIIAGGVENGNQWFSFQLKLQQNDLEIDLLPLVIQAIQFLPDDFEDHHYDAQRLEAFFKARSFSINLDDGRLLLIDSEKIAPILVAFVEAHGLIDFHIGEAGHIRELVEALEGSGIKWQGGKEILALGERLAALSTVEEIKPPKALNAKLRPYQNKGYGWLKALNDTGFGGALADDMGLGKTIQALSLLVEKHIQQEAERPSLLLVPTSLVGNWKREIENFAPSLKILILHGPERKALFKQINDHHVVITTYPLVHRDHEELFATPYECAILDEAQAVKNPASSIAKQIRKIDARHRIALSGTLVENNLGELWAVFDWLIPGLLGNRKTFTKEFRTPIEKQGSKRKQQLLSRRLKPFLLRRNKQEVATDLPIKTVINELVPLEDKQRALYETIRISMDERVKQAILKKGLSGSRITILDALLKMRQACCDPQLVKLEAAKKVQTSAKRERLKTLLEELMQENRKVLIFSQFVEMLKLIEQDIKEKGWRYSKLTGQTKKRHEEIDKFQNGDRSIFLISLKAGGVGLNLTAADTVILFDPWWNPAVENQAMDRAHRIGQDKPVFVYKMIAQGSVEEAIEIMQAKKQALADALFEGTEGGPMAMNENDIQALFSPLQNI